ncbi:MAG: hypothetical protein NZX77_14515, partial [Polyangiaceae bacterium]|nr:hypothetical protein [Polyangiaceae bacterium]
PRAYLRQVDIALKTQNTKDLEDLTVRMGATPGDPMLSYARAKALLALRRPAEAKAAAAAVPAGHPFHHQAKYLLGVAELREILSRGGGGARPPRGGRPAPP